LEILKNPEVIAVNQDPLCLQARVVRRTPDYLVLSKPVERADGRVRAVAMSNFSDSPRVIRVDMEELLLAGKCRVRDLWERRDVGVTEDSFEMEIPARSTAMLRIEGKRALPKSIFRAEYAFLNRFPEGARPVVVNRTTGLCVVRGIGGNEDNWLEFREVDVARRGEYVLEIEYSSAGERDLVVTVNGREHLLEGLASGGEDLGETANLRVELNKGRNVIRLSNPDAPAPDIYRIKILLHK
jgi:hypothetical protein